MKHIISGLIALLFVTSINAAEPFVYTGLVQVQADDASSLLINSQQYSVDLNTVVHGISMQGELGPMISQGQRIGYNIEQNNTESPYISEIWFLE